MADKTQQHEALKKSEVRNNIFFVVCKMGLRKKKANPAQSFGEDKEEKKKTSTVIWSRISGEVRQ